MFSFKSFAVLIICLPIMLGVAVAEELPLETVVKMGTY